MKVWVDFESIFRNEFFILRYFVYGVQILFFEFGYDSVFLIVTIIMDIVALLFCVSAAFSSAQDAKVGGCLLPFSLHFPFFLPFQCCENRNYLLRFRFRFRFRF
jgi:hypothetical protein